MLRLSKFIGKGATRICFEHPEDPNKCIKVAVRPKDNAVLEKELKTYFLVRLYIEEYLITYDHKPVDTNLGKGLVCELLRDDDGSYSKSLDYYLSKGPLDDEIVSQIWHFSYSLVEHDVFFYDFNLKNFIVQIKGGHKFLHYTDLKSFENYKSWTFLKLEKIIMPLARYLMIKRLKRLFDILEIPIVKS